MIFSRDTAPQARRVLIAALRRQTPAQRLAMVDLLFAEARALAAAGQRSLNPDAPPERIEELVLLSLLGPRLAGPVLRARHARDRR